MDLPPNDKGYWQSIVIESKLSYCSKCRIHEHNLSSCRKVKNNKRDPKAHGTRIPCDDPNKVHVDQPMQKGAQPSVTLRENKKSDLNAPGPSNKVGEELQ